MPAGAPLGAKNLTTAVAPKGAFTGIMSLAPNKVPANVQ